MGVNNFIDGILVKFSDKYFQLNDDVKHQLVYKKYFYGSNDSLGYYEPDLTDYLLDNMARAGKFSKSEPKVKKYFEYWYNSDNELIKIKYINRLDLQSCYDVIVYIIQNVKLFLFYGYDINGDIKLGNIYKLEYDSDKKLISIEKYIRDLILNTCDILEYKYMYAEKNLLSADINNKYQTWHFDFIYSSDNNLCSYNLDDGRHKYSVTIKENVIKKFEEFGLFHFSP